MLDVVCFFNALNEKAEIFADRARRGEGGFVLPRQPAPNMLS
jgi:hypothetical protein